MHNLVYKSDLLCLIKLSCRWESIFSFILSGSIRRKLSNIKKIESRPKRGNCLGKPGGYKGVRLCASLSLSLFPNGKSSSCQKEKENYN